MSVGVLTAGSTTLPPRSAGGALDLHGWLNGLAIVPVLDAFGRSGVLSALRQSSAEGATIHSLRPPAVGVGDFLAGLRTLALHGWLAIDSPCENPDQIRVATTRPGDIAFAIADNHKKIFNWAARSLSQASTYRKALAVGGEIAADAAHHLDRALERLRTHWFDAPPVDEWTNATARRLKRQMERHLDGVYLAPIIVALAMPGQDDSGPSDPIIERLQSGGARRNDPILLDKMIAALQAKRILVPARPETRQILTDAGRAIFRDAANFAVATSYAATFFDLGARLTGTGVSLRLDVDSYVDREMNIWGSGNSTVIRDFRVTLAREVITTLFDRLPLKQQPVGIADMGAGAGVPLAEMMRFVLEHTARGRALDQFPLVCLAIDPSPIAREIADRHLKDQGWPADTVRWNVLDGDVGDPDRLNAAIGALSIPHPFKGYDCGCSDFLHTQLFLLHDRSLADWSSEAASDRLDKALSETPVSLLRDIQALETIELPPEAVSENPIRFCTPGNRQGRFISAEIIASDLIELMARWRRWTPYGVVIFEPHAPDLSLFREEIPEDDATTMRIEIDPSPVVWCSHAMSDQYLITRGEHERALALAGFAPAMRRGTASGSISLAWWVPYPILYSDVSAFANETNNFVFVRSQPSPLTAQVICSLPHFVLNEIERPQACPRLESTMPFGTPRERVIAIDRVSLTDLPSRDLCVLAIALTGAVGFVAGRYRDGDGAFLTPTRASDKTAGTSDRLMTVAPVWSSAFTGAGACRGAAAALAEAHARERFVAFNNVDEASHPDLFFALTGFHRQIAAPSCTLQISAEYHDTMLEITVDADRRLMKHTEVTALARRVLRLTLACAEHSERCLMEIDLEGPFSKRRHNETSDVRAWHVIEKFRDQSATHADKLALTGHGVQLTFADVEKRVDKLAAILKQGGVEAGHVVALDMPLCPALPIAALACKARGALYAPPFEVCAAHNPVLPIAATIALEHSSLLPSTNRVGSDALRIYVETDGRYASTMGHVTGPQPVLPPNGFCVVRTSGTTARSNSLVLPEAGVVNRLSWMWRAFPFDEEECVLMLKTPALVGFIWEAFGGLLAGVRTCIAEPGDLRDPSRLYNLIAREGVTRLTTSPQIAQALTGHIESAHLRAPVSLRYAHLSGDVLNTGTTRAWQRTLPNAALFNMYGASECSSNATVYACTKLPENARHVPLGKPIDRVRISIEDRSGNPVPDGGLGQLVVEGPGTYLVKHGPEGAILQGEGSRWPSGDWGRLDPDHGVLLAGRRDNQVKIHGFRIQLEAVEAIVRTYPTVSSCVADLRRDEGRDLLILHYDGLQDEQGLRAYVAHQLPSYLRSAHFCYHDRLPCLSNGKPDRRALAAHPVRQPTRPVLIPESELEIVEYIRAVLQQCLNLKTVGADQSVLDQGGNSLRLIEAQAMLQKTFRRTIPIAIFFQYPTARSLARYLHCDGSPVVDADIEPTYAMRAFRRRRFQQTRKAQAMSIRSHMDLMQQRD